MSKESIAYELMRRNGVFRRPTVKSRAVKAREPEQVIMDAKQCMGYLMAMADEEGIALAVGPLREALYNIETAEREINAFYGRF